MWKTEQIANREIRGKPPSLTPPSEPLRGAYPHLSYAMKLALLLGTMKARGFTYPLSGTLKLKIATKLPMPSITPRPAVSTGPDPPLCALYRHFIAA